MRPEDHLPVVNAGQRLRVTWVNRQSEWPSLLVADAEHYVLLSLSGMEQGPNPWINDDGRGTWATQEVLDTDDASALDDTFCFRNA